MTLGLPNYARGVPEEDLVTPSGSAEELCEKGPPLPDSRETGLELDTWGAVDLL